MQLQFISQILNTSNESKLSRAIPWNTTFSRFYSKAWKQSLGQTARARCTLQMRDSILCFSGKLPKFLSWKVIVEWASFFSFFFFLYKDSAPFSEPSPLEMCINCLEMKLQFGFLLSAESVNQQNGWVLKSQNAKMSWWTMSKEKKI